MTYLVDANVLSEPTKTTPNLRVVEWLRSNEHALAVDPIILGEVRFGILLLPRGKRRSRLERWFDGGVQRLRCVQDSLIAATALLHGLAVATRNRADFEAAGVEIVDPFTAR